MSHRKFEAPRHGHLGFLPRKRCTKGRGRITSHPKDDASQSPHLTSFIGYKAGMTHIVRDFEKAGQKKQILETVEPVTIIDTPPMVVIGITGYTETTEGLKKVSEVFVQKISPVARRRMAAGAWKGKNKNAFRRNEVLYTHPLFKKDRELKFAEMLKKASVIRVIAHTQTQKVPIHQKKAHVGEIQVNGGSVEDKLEFAKSILGTKVTVRKVFSEMDLIDTISITKGKGTKGVVSRWGVTRLPRKTHKGLRKVACIGAWHPSRVSYAVARAGQKGFHHRTEVHKKIYRIGYRLSTAKGKVSAMTENDLTKKDINPVGGFCRYGRVRNDFLLLKGSVPGAIRRSIVLRKTIRPLKNKRATEKIDLKFIDTSSKIGRGRFQTIAEKKKFMGKTKKDLIRERARKEREIRRKRARDAKTQEEK